MSGKPEILPENSRKRRKFAAISIAALFLLTALLFVILKTLPETPEAHSCAFPVMGTIAQITVYAPEAELNRADELTRREFDRVTALCSLYDPASELSRINASAADAPVVCSPDMWQILMRAKRAYRESGGQFDITVKPLMDLWGFYRKRDQVPSDAEIDRTMKMVGFDKLRFDEKARTVFFTVPGMALDLGGIGKGFAVDLAAKALTEAGFTSGVIDLGGNLRMLTQPPPGKKFYNVAIRDPHDRDRVLPETLQVTPGMAVSTSGDYERFVIYNGKKYSHLLSPLTGRPGSVSAVTVVAPTAMDADVYSTSCALGGETTAAEIQKNDPETTIRFTR